MEMIVFVGQKCQACKFMKKSGRIDTFAKSHPEVKITYLDVDTEEGNKVANLFFVRALPTLVFTEMNRSSVLATLAGAPESNGDLDQLYTTAQHFRKFQATGQMPEIEDPEIEEEDEDNEIEGTGEETEEDNEIEEEEENTRPKKKSSKAKGKKMRKVHDEED